MARYQVILAYDGTRLMGSQRQAKSDGSGSPEGELRPRTVQGELEKALRGLGWTDGSVLLAGRTDSGVHATGQVAAFDLDWQHADSDLVNAMNAALPADLAVRGARTVAADFHPRFDAKSRTYRYSLFCGPVRDPLRERFAWRAWPDVNKERLVETASIFTGRHDFALFGSPTSPQGTTVRTVTRSEWRQAAGEWQYEVQADAFLYRMVRRLVFVQVAVAQGKLSVEAVAGALAGQAEAGGPTRRVATEGSVETQSKDPKRTGLPAGLAPAHGLKLVEVTY